MKKETKMCQNCKGDFTIDPDDFSFYEKIKVPPPTWCPPCRMTRRLAYGNSWGVYFRNCDKCGERTLTMYRPENPAKVYCDPCWWADDWDGTEYGIDYNPEKNFLEQWRELRARTPHFAKDAVYTSLKNCEYTNAIAFSKNCYFSFWLDYCENIYYSAFLNNTKDCIDIFRAYKSDLCYESVGVGHCSRIYFSNECDNCIDVWFSRNCYGCINCFGCANLRNKSYMIFNVKYSNEDYFKKMEEFKLNTRSGLSKMLEKTSAFWQKLPYREYTGNSLNLNVSGDYLYESKNAKHCYMCSGLEESKYTQLVSVPKATNCMDYYGWGNSADLIYECSICGEDISRLKFSYGIFSSGLDSEYCGFCIGAKNNFGCANLKRKQYCILNKVYPKEEYEKLKAKIIEDMNNNPYIDSLGRVYKYGEFFPPEFSLFPYEDSNASKFVKKSKEQALKEGYNWQDKIENTYEKTITGDDLPETIEEANDKVLDEIIECTSCRKAYRIVKDELNMYKKINIPLPNKCPRCREERRFSLINKPTTENFTNCAKCKKEIMTMYDLSLEKIIYCEKCYQQEVS